MAKIASSKLYGSGKPDKPPSDRLSGNNKNEEMSPIRTSPRRRKNLAGEEVKVEVVEKSKGRKPSAPKFNESKTKREEVRVIQSAEVTKAKTPKKTKAPKSPKSSKPKTELEPVIIERDEPVLAAEVVEPTEEEALSEMMDYVESIQAEVVENSPIFELDGNVEYEDYVEAATEGFHYDDEVEGEGEGGEDYESDALNEEEYNDQFKYTSMSVKNRLAQYFERQETSSVSDHPPTQKSQIWNRMKNWISVNFKDLSGFTVECTKRLVEEIGKRLESGKTAAAEEPEANNEQDERNRVIEDGETRLMDYEEDADYNENINENVYEHEQVEFVPESAPEIVDRQEIEVSGSFHSLPPENDVTAVLPARTSFESDVMDSRLTELVLFFAKCTESTPVPAIYEHLEEFFTLKGCNSLNFTEKQLISGVLKDFLTERDEEEEQHSAGGGIPVYELSAPAVSPKRVKVLPGSGIRFRAPKFTEEEERRLEELEQARQRNLISSNTPRISTFSTPSQRSKLQKKLLAPETTAEIIEGMPANRGRVTFGVGGKKDKNDSVSSAIEDIISQRVRSSED